MTPLERAIEALEEIADQECMGCSANWSASAALSDIKRELLLAPKEKHESGT